MYSSEAFLMHLYLILKISNYVEIASLLEIYTFLTYKKLGHLPLLRYQSVHIRNLSSVLMYNLY